ncbi:YkvA family protein [Bacillus sp. 1P06AnD]|uniref:YkvA family protein n=1 Tax=Bacillus sp. 1P06AnD TaxID=3132208 RepID=UPI00399F7B16
MEKRFFDRFIFKALKPKAEMYMNDHAKASSLLDKASSKKNRNKSSLKGVWNSFLTMIEMLKAWITGDYRKIPYRTLVLLFVGVIYFVSPVDIIPDFIIGLGLLDDVAVLGFIAKGIQKDIDVFSAWKKEKDTVYTIDYSQIQQ